MNKIVIAHQRIHLSSDAIPVAPTWKQCNTMKHKFFLSNTGIAVTVSHPTTWAEWLKSEQILWLATISYVYNVFSISDRQPRWVLIGFPGANSSPQGSKLNSHDLLWANASWQQTHCKNKYFPIAKTSPNFHRTGMQGELFYWTSVGKNSVPWTRKICKRVPKLINLIPFGVIGLSGCRSIKPQFLLMCSFFKNKHARIS